MEEKKSKMKKENIWSLRSENVIKTAENGFAQKELQIGTHHFDS